MPTQEDVYERRAGKRGREHQTSHAVEALGALAAAGALQQPELIRCDMCQVGARGPPALAAPTARPAGTAARYLGMASCATLKARGLLATQATFTTDAQYQQHVAGPVHRKAVDKLVAEQQRSERMAKWVAGLLCWLWTGLGRSSSDPPLMPPCLQNCMHTTVQVQRRGSGRTGGSVVAADAQRAGRLDWWPDAEQQAWGTQPATVAR